MDDICTLILAAGKGTRMKSVKPKVLHEILGEALIWYPLNIARNLSPEIIAVIGHGRGEVSAYLERFRIATEVQDPPLGTGHAVLVAREALQRTQARSVLIIPGDMPLIDQASVGRLIEQFRSRKAAMGILTAQLDDPFGYGRIVRAKTGAVTSIVEENDATAAQRRITEVNTAVYMVDKEFLLQAVARLNPDNAKGELYLTDIVTMAGTVVTAEAQAAEEANGINSREQLAQAAALMQERINQAHMRSGVTLIDPRCTWIGPRVKIAPDVEIWPGTHILGSSEIRGRTRILLGTWIADSTIGAECTIAQNCVLEGASIVPGSRIEPGTVIRAR